MEKKYSIGFDSLQELAQKLEILKAIETKHNESNDKWFDKSGAVYKKVDGIKLGSAYIIDRSDSVNKELMVSNLSNPDSGNFKKLYEASGVVYNK